MGSFYSSMFFFRSSFSLPHLIWDKSPPWIWSSRHKNHAEIPFFCTQSHDASVNHNILWCTPSSLDLFFYVVPFFSASPLNHHLRAYAFIFSKHLKQIQVRRYESLGINVLCNPQLCSSMDIPLIPIYQLEALDVLDLRSFFAQNYVCQMKITFWLLGICLFTCFQAIFTAKC